MSERYDDVRRKLVARGYLHGPIERFLLRDLLVAGGALGAVLRTSVKAAVLGAPLLGGLLAASAVAASRPLLGARDAVVLWSYCAALAAAVLFCLDAAAAGIAAAWARRRGARSSDALRAGLLVAAPVLVYLVVLQARGRPAGSLAATALFLAGAVISTALIAWLAGIVSLAAIVGRTGDVPDRNRGSAALLLAVLFPIALAFFLIPTVTAPYAAVPPSPFRAESRDDRALVVGVDGLDGGLVAALAPRGAVEHLLSVVAKGSMFPVHRPAGLEPAEVWTTIATGRTAEEHGVHGAGATRLPGVATPLALRGSPGALAALRFLVPVRTVPSTGAARTVPAIWEMAGRVAPSASVGFWATWPARGVAGDPSSGYVVSDRVLAKLLSDGSEDRDVRPQALFALLAADFRGQRPAWKGECEARFGSLPSSVAAVAWESVLIDEFSWEVTKRLLGDGSVRDAFVYLPGLDILRSRLKGISPQPGGGALVAAQALEAYVGWLDAAVFADLEARGAAWRIVIIADPGRSADAQTEGFAAVIGAGAAPACVGPSLAVLDVAPLTLRVLGLPPSGEMSGQAPSACFANAPEAPAPIATWGRRGAPRGEVSSEYDPEMLERLKSLGYLR